MVCAIRGGEFSDRETSMLINPLILHVNEGRIDLQHSARRCLTSRPRGDTGQVASYVARLPMPAPDAKTWLESVTISPDVSPALPSPDNSEDNQAYTSQDARASEGEPE
jgi:hypothetical protein